MVEARKCLRPLNHSGYCTPDLSKLKFGKMFVIAFLGSPKSGRCVRWLVDINGVTRSIEARNLISGTSSGKRLHQHGLRGSEYDSAWNHYALIFNKSRAGHKYYNGMPFFDGWNPKKGGEIWRAAKWIIDNLGKKPDSRWSLDIIEHRLGFVPGNLRWALKNTQMRNQNHRMLEKISDEEFAVEAKRRGYIRYPV